MNAIMVNNVRNWWNTIRQDLRESFRRLARFFDRLARGTFRMMAIGVILNVVASYFYPAFPEKFPILYAWFNGWLQLGEFLFKVGLGSLYSIFTGNFGEFWVEYGEALKELVAQFTQWLATIHF